MNDEKIDHVVCAIRGRPEFTRPVLRAVELAREHNAHLTFLMVIEAEFMGKATPTLRPVGPTYRRLEDLARFTLRVLCQEARELGVPRVDYLFRRGDVRRQLRQFAEETHAQVMVMGKPVPGSPRSVFTPEEFEAFVEELEREGGIRVIALDPEEGDPDRWEAREGR
jgi:nucleotide-binding universal stress UspA family protein